MAYLYRIGDDGSVLEGWELGTDPAVVGRGESAEVRVQDDALSRSHFVIVYDGDNFALVDLQSSNGTWVDGRRIRTHKLATNARIRAGGSHFHFDPSPELDVAILAAQGQLGAQGFPDLRTGATAPPPPEWGHSEAE
jgi:pSer/pThr/pTyr-binding forkhead associated (FHA) protein